VGGHQSGIARDLKFSTTAQGRSSWPGLRVRRLQPTDTSAGQIDRRRAIGASPFPAISLSTRGKHSPAYHCVRFIKRRCAARWIDQGRAVRLFNTSRHASRCSASSKLQIDNGHWGFSLMYLMKWRAGWAGTLRRNQRVPAIPGLEMLPNSNRRNIMMSCTGPSCTTNNNIEEA